MAFKYTNKNNLTLPLAVFLLNDTYAYDDRPNAISATSLLKPLRELVLSMQHKDLNKTVDIADMGAARMGSAIHSACEAAWKNEDTVREALRTLGAGDGAVRNVKINPTEVKPGDTPIYVEQRVEKEIDGFIISGQFDLVLAGTVNDYKSATVWKYIYDSDRDKYVKQGSIYKWLNPDKITEDIININYIFTDWSPSKARETKNYPPFRTAHKAYPLWSVQETENWISSKLQRVEALLDQPQNSSIFPECTDEELWATDEVFKYYKNPTKTDRSTKNFATMDEALQRKSQDGDVGMIRTVPGEVKACRYCSVVEICKQAQDMQMSGRLHL